MKDYLKGSADVLAELASSPDGLTESEAEARLQQNGKNKLVEGKKESLLRRFLKQLAEPMTIILIAAAVISAVMAVMNNEFPSDVIIIMAVVHYQRRTGRRSGEQGGKSHRGPAGNRRRNLEGHPRRTPNRPFSSEELVAGRYYRSGSRRCGPRRCAHSRMRKPEDRRGRPDRRIRACRPRLRTRLLQPAQTATFRSATEKTWHTWAVPSYTDAARPS